MSQGPQAIPAPVALELECLGSELAGCRSGQEQARIAARLFELAKGGTPIECRDGRSRHVLDALRDIADGADVLWPHGARADDDGAWRVLALRMAEVAQDIIGLVDAESAPATEN